MNAVAVPYRTSRPQTVTLPCGPFTGMRDRKEPTSSRPDLARMLRNVYPAEPHHLSCARLRPGFQQLGAQLGSGGDVQYIGQFTELDGTEHTIAIVGGKFYTLNWGTSTWTETLSAAQLSSASITLNSTARVYALTFANEIIFSDGVNTPWSWDGTSGGGLTSLTNAPVIFGQPISYYGKWFGIKDTDRATFVWSEEGLINTGFENGGYNNAWTLRQTDQNRLIALLGANEALYVFRERSTTLIVGEVTKNFSSTGTREGISSTIGTRAPASVVFANDLVFFSDADGRPHYLPRGGKPVPIWEDFERTLLDIDSTVTDEIEAYWDPTTELVLHAHQAQGETERSTQLGYHFEGGHAPIPATVFDGYTFTRIGVVKNANGDPRVLHGSTDGYVYEHGTPSGSIWDDGFAAGSEAIAHEIKTNWVGYSESLEKLFDRADLIFIAESDFDVAVSIETNKGPGTAQTLSFTGGFARWDDALWDVDEWADDQIKHGAAGFNSFGYYASLVLTHSGAGERFCFVSGQLQGRPISKHPGFS